MPRSLQRAWRIITPAGPVARQIRRRQPAAGPKLRVVPLGVDERFFKPVSPAARAAVRERYELPPEFCLFLGNLEPKKNLTNLLAAFDRLPEAPPLVIAGGIAPWPGLEARMGRVQLLGFVEAAHLPALLASCELFCFPSLAEGFGLPVLEAMACGAAVVTSPGVPLPELEYFAQLAPPRSVEALAAAIARLLADKELRATRSHQGRAYAGRFTWESSARQTLAVYEELGVPGGAS
jgi:alpha-1,3-rhamnosyl/mannosyltransferase